MVDGVVGCLDDVGLNPSASRTKIFQRKRSQAKHWQLMRKVNRIACHCHEITAYSFSGGADPMFIKHCIWTSTSCTLFFVKTQSFDKNNGVFVAPGEKVCCSNLCFFLRMFFHVHPTAKRQWAFLSSIVHNHNADGLWFWVGLWLLACMPVVQQYGPMIPISK